MVGVFVLALGDTIQYSIQVREEYTELFRNLLQARNYQEARSLLVCKQEAFQSLSKTFVQSVNLMQLLQDVFNMFSSSS